MIGCNEERRGRGNRRSAWCRRVRDFAGMVVAVAAWTACASQDGECWQSKSVVRTCAADPPVDLLLVVSDNRSGGVLTERFSEHASVLVDGLLDPSTLGMAGAAPVTDLHVAVITADLGSGGPPYDLCPTGPRGDDGLLMGVRDTVAGCPPDLPAYLATPDVRAEALSCLLRQGDQGCAFTQPLEVTVRALAGHGDGANRGFLRPDSLLAIFLLTTSDDCSAADPALHEDGPDLALRCYENDALLASMERYHCFLDQLGRPSGRVLVGGAIPVPLDWDGDITDPRLVPRRMDGSYAFVCTRGEMDREASYWPAPRLAEVVSPEATSSACIDDPAEAFRRFASAVHAMRTEGCP